MSKAVDVTRARKALDRATEAKHQADAELETARRADPVLEAARLRDERADEEAKARAALAAVEREATRVRYETAVETSTSWPSRVRNDVARLVDLDKVVATIADAIADVILDAQEAFDESELLAAELGCRADQATRSRRPKMADARALARVALATARDARDGDGAEGWLSVGARPAWDNPSRPAWDAALKTLADLGLTGDTTEKARTLAARITEGTGALTGQGR